MARVPRSVPDISPCQCHHMSVSPLWPGPGHDGDTGTAVTWSQHGSSSWWPGTGWWTLVTETMASVGWRVWPAVRRQSQHHYNRWHMTHGHHWHGASHYYNQDMKMEKLKSGCHKETHCHFSLVLTQPDTSPQMTLGTFNDFLAKCAKILTMAKYYWCCYMLQKSLKSFL